MSEHNTHEHSDAAPFEERVLAHLNSISLHLSTMDSRLTDLEDKVERRLQDTRPIWEAVLARLAGIEEGMRVIKDEMAALKDEVRTGFRRLERKQDILNKEFLERKADVDELDERLTKLEESRS